MIFLQTGSSILHENSFQTCLAYFFCLSRTHLTHQKRNTQFSAEKDTNVSMLKFTLALTFCIVNSLVSYATSRRVEFRLLWLEVINVKDQSHRHLEEHIPIRLAHQDPGLDLEVRENQEIREVVAIQEDQGDRDSRQFSRAAR